MTHSPTRNEPEPVAVKNPTRPRVADLSSESLAIVPVDAIQIQRAADLLVPQQFREQPEEIDDEVNGAGTRPCPSRLDAPAGVSETITAVARFARAMVYYRMARRTTVDERLLRIPMMQMKRRLNCQTVGPLAGVLVLGLLAVGCAPKKAPSKLAPQPASAEAVQTIRDAYFRAYPDSRVGVVTAVRPQNKLVAVGEVNGADFREGDLVTFIDAHQKVLTTGTVVRVLSDSVHVVYENPSAGGRVPLVGDIMVKLPFGAATL
jgi:hypothetical protein